MSYLYDCKNGLPCDLRVMMDKNDQPLDFSDCKYEQCICCGRKVKFKKYNKKVDWIEYLDAHPRDFCQRFGRYKKLYAQLYGLKKRDHTMKGTNNA